MKRDHITIGVLTLVFVGIISTAFAAEPKWVVSVSNTHLTLPPIYSV